MTEIKSNLHAIKNLASDLPGLAPNLNEDLVNPWGLDSSLVDKRRVFWVANNGTGIINGLDSQGKVVKRIIVPSSTTGEITPITGLVVAGKRIFVSSEDGKVAVWKSLKETRDANDTAKIVISKPGAVYKGIAVSDENLYVTNFASGFVEIYNKKFQFVTQFTNPSLSPQDAKVPGFAPFNILAAEKELFVTFALQNDEKKDDVAGDGLGFVDVFDLKGAFLRRLVTSGPLNAPWGLNLDKKCGKLYIGNFGNGTINVFDAKSGKLESAVLGKNGEPIAISGLWGILFSKDELFFTAGVASEEHGVFGKIKNF